MHWRRQGDIGELSAAAWLAGRGAKIAVPLGHTSTGTSPQSSMVVCCTRGGNRSWDGVVKRLDPSRFDYLFVHVADGRRWFIPAGEVTARSAMLLGGERYRRFEVDPGQPFLSDARAGAV